MSDSSMYVDGEYLANNPHWHTADSPWKARQILERLEANSLAPQKIAEIGCGAGQILLELHDAMAASCQFTGYEISPDAFAMCDPGSRDRVTYEFANLLDTDRYFDMLLVMDVAEHVEDYFSFLRELRHRAKYTMIHVPLELSAQTVLRNSPLVTARKSVGHIHQFTRDAFHASLVDTGHEVIDWAYTSPVLDGRSKTIKQRIGRLPRKVGYRLSPELTVRCLGGFSAMFLTRSADAD